MRLVDPVLAASLRMLFIVSGVAALGVGAPAAAAVRLTPQTLRAEGQMLHTLVRDLDGDGRNELIVIARRGRPSRPLRTLYVWRSTAKGFAERPTAEVPIPSKVVAVDVCDVDPAAGQEILFLHSRGLDAVTQTKPLEFARKPKPVIDQRSSLAFADPSDAPFVELCQKPRGAGPELWIPTWSGVQVFSVGPEGPKEGPLLNVGPRASHLIDDEFRGPRARRDYAVLTTLAYPKLYSMDADKDGDDDVYATIEDRVWLFLRDGGQLGGAPAARRFFGLRTPEEFREGQNRLRVYFGDVSGDGLPDAVTVKNTGRISNLKTELKVFRGLGTRGFDKKELATRKHDGYAVPEAVVDVDGDGVAEIIEPALDTGPASVAQLVMTLTIDMEFHALKLKKGRLVEGEEMELEFGFEFGGSGVKGTLPLFGQDIDGDGITDRVDLGLGDSARIFRGQRGDPVYDDDEAQEVSVDVTQKASWYTTKPGAPASVVIYRPKDKKLGGTITVLWNPKG